MRKAQISIFIILGLVLVMTVAVLLTIAKESKPADPAPTIEDAQIKARACLSKSTQAAIAALKDDAIITADESGPLERNPTNAMYIKANPNPEGLPSLPMLPKGLNGYWGLCDRDGPNGVDKVEGVRYPCAPEIYARFRTPSIQEQLRISVQSQMQRCLESEGTAQVIIQRGAVVSLWDEPEIQYTHRIRLPAVWKAIKHMVNQELSDNEAISTDLSSCEGCDGIEITRGSGNDYLFSADGQPVATVHLEDRGIAIQYPDGNIKEDDIHYGACGDECDIWEFDEQGIRLVSQEYNWSGDFYDIATFTYDPLSEPNKARLTWEGCGTYKANITLRSGSKTTQVRNIDRSVDGDCT